jgi:hypothetical protein
MGSLAQTFLVATPTAVGRVKMLEVVVEEASAGKLGSGRAWKRLKRTAGDPDARRMTP